MNNNKDFADFLSAQSDERWGDLAARGAALRHTRRFVSAWNHRQAARPEEGGYRVGLNHMADWSGAERRAVRGRLQGSAADATREAAIADARARGVVSDFRPSGVYYEEDEEQKKNTEKEGKSHGGADGHAMRARRRRRSLGARQGKRRTSSMRGGAAPHSEKQRDLSPARRSRVEEASLKEPLLPPPPQQQQQQQRRLLEHSESASSSRPSSDAPPAAAAVPFLALPKEVDWRDAGVVGAVKDQGTCGSCCKFENGGSGSELGLTWKVRTMPLRCELLTPLFLISALF